MDILYRTEATATGGRTGRATTTDGLSASRSSPRRNLADRVVQATTPSSSSLRVTLPASSARSNSSRASAR